MAATWPKEAVSRYVAKGYWEGRPLGEHLYEADIAPEVTCLVEGEVRLSFRDLMRRADNAAIRLRALGLRPDDRIIVQLPNCWEFVVLVMGCLRLGVIPVFALPAFRRTELSAIAAEAEARAIVVPDTTRDFDHQQLAHELADDVPTIRYVLVVGSEVRVGSVDARAYCEPASDPVPLRKELDESAPAGDAIAWILVSGGTTGLPKMVPRTHNDLAYMAKRAAQICESGPDSVYLAVLPMAHGFPLLGPGVFGTLMAGGRVVIGSSPTPERAFRIIESERVTETSVVPAILRTWLTYQDENTGRDLSTLRLLQVGAARLPPDMARQVGSSLGCTLQQVYGMSEGLLCLTRLDDSENVILHSQGRPICPDDELLIVDDEGNEVAEGDPGLLLTRGPYTPPGSYFGHGAADNSSFMWGGWCCTGDIVRRRPDGNLVVEGRQKDIINRGGEKISSEEVEALVQQLCGVSAAAAVAMPDIELGERMCLFVVPRSGKGVTLAEVRSAMERAEVARFKLPERLELIDALPTTPIGKTDRKALRKWVADLLAAEDENRHPG